jgi:glycosyltransferase involved in cell wall biosynthesis
VRTVNVLDLRDTYEIGGPGKTILETYRAIDRSRFSLHLGVFLRRDERDDTPFITAARAYGVPVHLLRGYNQYDPRLVLEVVRLVRKLDIHIMHAHEVKSDVIGYLAAKVTGVPIVTTLHGWIGNSRKQKLFIGLDRRIVRGFDRVIAVSGKINDEMAATVPPSRLRLVHNAIVVERYHRTGRSGFLPQLVGRPIAGPVIATIGRISPEKGQADLVEALAAVRQRGHRVTAVLAGDGPDKAGLTARVEELGLADSVHFPGYVEQPERILEETDLMVLPSHTEGLPNAALEAMAMGVPVLATRVGGTPEVVTDGETGRLVPAHSPAALADGIVDFLVNPGPWKVMAGRGRGVVEQRFNFAARTRAIEAVYAELLEGSRA